MMRKVLAAMAVLMAGGQAAAATGVTARLEVMVGAFGPGFVGEADDERYPLRTVRIGELNLSSGRLILADPLIVSEHDKPVDLTLRPGRYPVDIAVADTGKGGHRVALARLLLSDAPPVRWGMAVNVGEDVRTLKRDHVFSYGVDSGTGGFLDAGAVAWMSALSAEKAEALNEAWIERGEAQGPKLGLPYGFALAEEVGPGGVVMMSSGWGDGAYASWVGYDAAGKPVQVVTDFAVIEAVDIPK